MLVMKFGGSSVATAESFHKIAAIIANKSKQESAIVVVVSAMGNTTDQLLELARKVHPSPPAREQDMLVSVGERISIALLAMALSLQGKDAVSFTGSQSGIITTGHHTEAKILAVKPTRLLPVLQQNKIAIVAGFQGVSARGEITTLGRGGSDSTAVALAIALGASRVEFYKDVPGIFDFDPKKNKEARLLPYLSYKEALQLTETGAKVLHSRSVELAEKNGVELAIHSFFQPEVPGTLVGKGPRKETMIYEEVACLCS